MISSIEFISVTPVVRQLSSARPVTVFGSLGAGLSGLRGGLLASTPCGVQADAFAATGGVQGGMGRATQAPLAESARIEESVVVANGAGHRVERQHPAGKNNVTKHYPSKKWAFRGLEPWRDPA